MVKITASDVNMLRQQTGAGMMDCKKALVEAEGNIEKATDLLRKQGQKIAAKRGEKAATEGYILAKTDPADKLGVVISLNCETDFVARTEDFVNYAKSIVNLALESKSDSLEGLKSTALNGSTVQDGIIAMSGKIGEKIELSSYEKIESESVIAYNGELERCTSFKEKIKSQGENINAGLLTYPVLMAADIIIHKANKVPVGKDQEQHLEMTRTFARRFNRMYGVEYFPEPQAYNFGKSLVKIPGLDGSGKMGKSEGDGNAVFLNDTPESIQKKVMKAVTDSGPQEVNQKKPESIENLFAIMKVVSREDTYKHFDDLYNNREIRYGDFKKQLAEDIITFNAPIREKIKDLENDDAYLKKVVKQGAEKARESAAKTVSEVREIIGIRKF